MSQDYIIQTENSKHKLTHSEKSAIINKIADTFTTYNDARSSNLAKSDALINEIFFKNNYSTEGDKYKRWKSKVKMCKMFMFYQTLKAFIWKNIYSNVNSMFDVSGENHESDNFANRQKAILVDIFEKMDYQKTCDTILDNALLYGEMISFTAWKKHYEEYRRPVSFFKNVFQNDVAKLPQILDAVSKGQNFWTDVRKVYDNPYIYPVNPADLVFDVTQLSNWDDCPKIYKSFKTPYEIINNKLYTISKEEAEEIKNLINPPSTTDLSNQSKRRLYRETVNGSTVEVLEHWGDFRMPDGTLLKNWHAVVVARKYLVKFSKNERIINPFTYGAFVVDPETRRGISPLYSILNLALVQENLLNRTCDMQSLAENPPILAPEGFFDQEEIELYPGKIIEYGDNISPNNLFKQLDFNVNVFLNDISFIDDLMSEVSGIYPNMVGNNEETSKTATEITTKTQGQLTRLSMMLDIINQYLIIPDVKNVAKLCADFKTGTEKVYLNNNNQRDVVLIDDQIRQGDYRYTYADRSGIVEKSQRADMVVSVIERFAQSIPLDIREIFTWYFEQKGVENPERFLAKEQPQQNQAAAVMQNLMSNPQVMKQLNEQIQKLAGQAAANPAANQVIKPAKNTPHKTAKETYSVNSPAKSGGDGSTGNK